jgi:hypothetical protein
MRGRMAGMKDRNDEWLKFKASAQAELCEFMSELNRLGLDQPAAEVRRLAISPENFIATGNEWHYVVWETTDKLSRDPILPADLRERLREFAEAVDPRYKGPS